MEKLLRFIILALLFVVTAVLFYSVIPSIAWIFGGSFRAVAQHPMYVILFCLMGLPMQGFLFGECFDSKFYAKR